MHDLSRSAILDRLRQADPPEVLVVGAGINGAAVFWDLSLQGVRAVLVDKDDIGSGASAAPSRMVHGGLCHLEAAEIELVRQSTCERNLLLRNARNLVAPLRTIVPLYSRWDGAFAVMRKLARLPSGSGRRGSALVRIGLTLYDLLGRRAPLLRRTGCCGARRRSPTCRVSRRASPQQPSTTTPGSRIPTGWTSNSCWTRCTPCLTARRSPMPRWKASPRARCWCATGSAARRCASRRASSSMRGGAWVDRVNAPLGVLRCDEAEVDYLFAVLREVFPDIVLGREHIVFRYTGVRPLPHVDAASTALIPRSHSLPVSEPEAGRPFPVFSMLGGKWTTFRGFGEEVADAMLRRLGRGRRVDTSGCAIGGGRDFPATPATRMAWIRQVAGEARLPEGRVATLLDRYGTRARALALAAGSKADSPLKALPDYSRAEIAWILREELVAHLADLVLRRTLIAIRG